MTFLNIMGGVALILVMNRANAAPVWFFWLTDPQRPINVVWLMLSSALATLVVWWTIRITRGLVRDLQEVGRVAEMERMVAVQKQRDADLKERERRIDDKLQKMESAPERNSEIA